MKEQILWLVETFQSHPYLYVGGGLVVCGLGVPLPEEFFLVMSGYVSYKNGVPDVQGLIPMFLVTWFAILGGDACAFSVGRWVGPRLFETKLGRRLVTPAGRKQAEQFLAQYGNKTIFAARFLPGIRMPTYLLCGTLGVPLITFMFWDGLAMAISVPTQVYLTWKYGAVLDVALIKIAHMNRALLIVAIFIALGLYWKIHTGGTKAAIPADDADMDKPAAPIP